MPGTPMPGLAAGPMGAWLAAAGALRMTARTDPAARLRWDGTIPVLTTGSPVPVRDIADRAEYTPVITPWQSGGGWGEKDKTPVTRLARLAATRTPRLAAMRAAITTAGDLVAAHPAAGKDTLVRLLRNALPGEALPWLDAAVPLRSLPGHPGSLGVAFAPLAGTGGNDARWDLSTTYHEAILQTAPDHAPGPGGATLDDMIARRRGWLHDLLGGTETVPLATVSGGPYWPPSGLANPWAIILATEGLCAFGDSAAPVHGARRQPWTTAPGPELAADDTWGEAWLPMWAEPMSAAEVTLLLGGPQPRWHGHAARTPAEMLSSLAVSGWPAAVTGYARYGLARRRGRAHIAVPLGILIPATAPGAAWLDAAAAAAAAGVASSTWRAYVARGQAPPAGRRDPRTGRPEWEASTIETWQATRPGPGVRTDLPG